MLHKFQKKKDIRIFFILTLRLFILKFLALIAREKQKIRYLFLKKLVVIDIALLYVCINTLNVLSAN